MDEDLLSPQMGRLIDEAKAAARRTGADVVRAEGVALLTGAGTVHTGYAEADPGSPLPSAAEVALGGARQAGQDEILAAAAAVPTDPAETVLPSAESCRVLAGIDPELPLVFKQQGRWVMLPLSQVPVRV